MKKRIASKLIAGVLTGATILLMAGCGKNDTKTAESSVVAQSEETTTQSEAVNESEAADESEAPVEKGKITVGVCAGPYGDMFEDCIKPSLNELGYEVEIIEISDIVTPNTAVDEGEITINVFQHSIYLNNFNKEHGTHLTYVTEIPTAGMGTFSDKYEKLEDLPDGAKIAIPNDVTNTARALRVLAQTGLIELDQNVEQATVTVDNVTSNPKGFEFEELNPEVLPNILDSVDAAVINGYFAIAAGLDLSTDLYNEKVTDGYINVIAVREEDADSEITKTIDKIVHSDAFRTAIEDESKQYKSFTKPEGYYEPSKFE
ncbi:MAG: metal ABC transporter substrate-binding protein [Lachnospiraceae bacterium]|nr:metal ABC transporter substrate-binding protein [Lachnospiraceae bacterium]